MNDDPWPNDYGMMNDPDISDRDYDDEDDREWDEALDECGLLPPHLGGNLVTACRACNCSRQDKPLSCFAGKETIAHIRRNCKRDLAPYRKLAKQILAGELEYDADMESAE